jgi:hypothetical protein
MWPGQGRTGSQLFQPVQGEGQFQQIFQGNLPGALEPLHGRLAHAGPFGQGEAFPVATQPQGLDPIGQLAGNVFRSMQSKYVHKIK